MTTENENQQQEVTESRLDALKRKADMMGITYHPNIGEDKLKERIDAHLEGKADVMSEMVPDRPYNSEDGNTPIVTPRKETEGEKRVRLKKAANELVRVRITCMNPNRREHEGEIFTGGNTFIGTYRKYIPFDVEWHVPRVLLNIIEDRKCQVFHTVTDSRGNKGRKGKLVKEFSVEYLDPLTPEELRALAQRQLMAQGKDAA
jgi:hypothetical protein